MSKRCSPYNIHWWLGLRWKRPSDPGQNAFWQVLQEYIKGIRYIFTAQKSPGQRTRNLSKLVVTIKAASKVCFNFAFTAKYAALPPSHDVTPPSFAGFGSSEKRDLPQYQPTPAIWAVPSLIHVVSWVDKNGMAGISSFTSYSILVLWNTVEKESVTWLPVRYSWSVRPG